MIKHTFLPAHTKTPTAVHSPARPVRRILVADADPFFRHRNAEALIRNGYEVNAVQDGMAVWEELELNHYHLLIVENKLPRLTGLEIVRKLHSACMPLPVIMATEKLPPARAARHFPSHPMITLLKPYTITEFLDSVRVVLGAIGTDARAMEPSAGQARPPAVGLRL